MITNINKLGGVKSDLAEFFLTHTERSSALVIVPKAAIFVSLLCMSIFLLTLTACSEDDASSIENNLNTDTRINTLADTVESVDSTDTSHAVISDWEEGKSGEVVPMTKEEIERLLGE